MKHVFTFLTFIFASLVAFSQAPNTMSYQAVIRDANNNLVSNQSVGMQISILQGSANGSSVYTETQTASTNDNGLVSIAIGEGTTNDNFSSIDWANGPYFIKTETDLTGGSNYTITGTSQLLSVPYALYSGNGIKSVSNSGDTLFLGNGGFVIIPGISPANTSAQLATLSTTAASSITAISAVSGGTITNNGGATITARGVVWSTSQNPTLASYLGSTNDSSGTGTFTSNLTGLTASTTYYVRAYATNSAGTAYGNEVSFTTTAGGGSGTYPPGTVHCTGTPTAIVDVTNPTTGKTWMDRNLGASQAATNSTDANAYGDLYQWGRAADGHQCRNSATTSTLSSIDHPGHGDFITISSGNYDWRSPQNDNLWQGVNGTNNPCPSGYRLPTSAELDAEHNSWSSDDAAGAFASPLKLPAAGGRSRSDGSLGAVGTNGLYWSSTVVFGTNANNLFFYSSLALVSNANRARGHSVRCLKD